MEIENWKKVEGYEEKYEVSDLGRIKSLKRKSLHSTGNEMYLKEKILNPQKDTAGYLFVRFYINNKYKNFRINVLVYKTFKPYYDFTLVVDHINNIKTDNRLINLQQLTNRENIIKSKKSNTGFTGIYLTRNNRYHVKIQINREVFYLGNYLKIEDALRQYNDFKNKNNI